MNVRSGKTFHWLHFLLQKPETPRTRSQGPRSQAATDARTIAEPYSTRGDRLKRPMASVLVLGNYRQTLAVVRSLSAAGYAAIVGRSGERTPVECSRCVSEVWSHPPLAESTLDEFMTALDAFAADRPDVGLVFPIGDAEIPLIARAVDRLPKQIKPVIAAPDVVEKCLDKSITMQLAAELGVPQSRYEFAQDNEAVIAAAERVGLPCIVKAESEHGRVFGEKARIYASLADLESDFREATPPPHGFVVQHYFQGRRHNIYFFAQRGELKTCLQVRILRTDRSDDTGYAVDGESVKTTPALARHTAALVEGLSYNGAGCAQFLIDEATGAISFLEINSRLGANFAITRNCGMDLPHWFVKLTESPQADFAFPKAYKLGRRYAWTYGDLMGLKHALGRRELSIGGLVRRVTQVLTTFAMAHMHITWSWRDPLPTLHQYFAAVAKRLPLIRAK